MFPLGSFRIVCAETEALDDRSLIWSFEEFQRNAAIEDLGRFQRAGAFSPASIGQRKAADGVPLAFEKIQLLRVSAAG
jgi:hypothetical protein